jgi:exosortase/archaeosortase family protein
MHVITTSILSEEKQLRLGWLKQPALFQMLALLPVIHWFCQRLNDGSDEPLGLLTLVLALALAWRDRSSLVVSRAARIGGAVLILLSVIGIFGLPPLLRAGLAITGVAMTYGIHRKCGLLGLLMLSLPVAASMQFYLGYPLRLVAAEGTIRLLELFSIVAFRSGTQIELGGKIIGVDPACSGVRMLWHALVAAMALAAIHRLTWRATVIGGLLAIVLVIPANVMRATLLVAKETGNLPGMFIDHGGVGLVSFAVILLPLWLAISSRAQREKTVGSFAPSGVIDRCLLVIAALLVPCLMFTSRYNPAPIDSGKMPTVFTFDGMTLSLHPLPPSPAEMAFSKSFPGSLASYQWGTDQVILRRVNEATRRLHSSGDCLRAAGFEITEAITETRSDNSKWARFDATRDGVRWTVHERIISERDGSSWTDVSAWFWFALWHPLNGPWQAETVLLKFP